MICEDCWADAHTRAIADPTRDQSTYYHEILNEGGCANTQLPTPPRFDSTEPDVVEIEVYAAGGLSRADVIGITVPGHVWFGLDKGEQAQFVQDVHAAIGPWLDAGSRVRVWPE